MCPSCLSWSDIHDGGLESLKAKLKERLLQDHAGVRNALAAHESSLVQCNARLGRSVEQSAFIDSLGQQLYDDHHGELLQQHVDPTESSLCPESSISSSDSTVASDMCLRDSPLFRARQNEAFEVDVSSPWVNHVLFPQILPDPDSKLERIFSAANINCRTITTPRLPDASIYFKFVF